MAVLEIELPDETARKLVHEAASFEFADRETYVRWLIEHRAVTFDGEAEAADWRTEVEARLQSLEAQLNGTRATPGQPDPVKEVLDEQFADVYSADDEDVERAIAAIDATLGEELDL